MLRVCANCRVLVEPSGPRWRHVPIFAEKFSRAVCEDPAPGREPSGSETRFGLARIKTPGGDKQVIKDAIPELAQPAGVPVTLGVDGSYKLTIGERVVKPMSWAYLATNGCYGLGTTIVPGTIVGEQRWLQAELRAIAAGLHAVADEHPVRILSDCQDALKFITLWRGGYDVWPGGYNPERAGGRESTLGRLARRIREAGDLITAEWVPGHTGHPLNEAADALAKMARAWATDRMDKTTVANHSRRIVLESLGRYAATVG